MGGRRRGRLFLTNSGDAIVAEGRDGRTEGDRTKAAPHLGASVRRSADGGGGKKRKIEGGGAGFLSSFLWKGVQSTPPRTPVPELKRVSVGPASNSSLRCASSIAAAVPTILLCCVENTLGILSFLPRLPLLFLFFFCGTGLRLLGRLLVGAHKGHTVPSLWGEQKA